MRVWTVHRLSMAIPRLICAEGHRAMSKQRPSRASSVMAWCKHSQPVASFQDLPFYAALPLDRAGHLRSDAKAVAELENSPDARLVPVFSRQSLLVSASALTGTQLPASKAEQAWRAAYMCPASAARSLVNPRIGLVFLGLDDASNPWFAAACSDPEAVESLACPPGAAHEWVDLRRDGPALPAGDAALLALGAGLVAWHHNNLHCGRTGAETVPLEAGHSRAAGPARAPQVYPRIDPAVIVAVACGEWLLLGRQARWAPGRYSLLAGFAEVGETLEQAAVREVKEEAGVAVDLASVSYFGSQPWPFPQTLMCGFLAHTAAVPAAEAPARGLDWLQGPGRRAAENVGLTPVEAEAVLAPAAALPVLLPDTEELQDARWVHRSFLARHLAGEDASPGTPFTIPGQYAIAHQIIVAWVRQGGAGAAASSNHLQGLPAVAIEAAGRFKYVLLRATQKPLIPEIEPSPAPASRLLVRGTAAAGYHRDVLAAAQAEAWPDVQVQPLGGGRIAVDACAACISIFGYSSEFGPAVHEIAAALVRRSFPLHTVTVSYDGY